MLKLHIGCGPRILKGWVNIDLKYQSPLKAHLKAYDDPTSAIGTKEDLLILDVTEAPLPYPVGSVDLIFNEDFIEHLCQRDQIVFLAETLRVLKLGGGQRINTPNLRQVQRRSVFSNGFYGVATNPEWDRWHHQNVLSETMLEELALMVGYSQVVFNTRNKSLFAADLPLEFRPGSDRREDENIFADLIK